MGQRATKIPIGAEVVSLHQNLSPFFQPFFQPFPLLSISSVFFEIGISTLLQLRSILFFSLFHIILCIPPVLLYPSSYLLNSFI